MYVKVGLITIRYWKEILLGFLSLFIIIFICIFNISPSDTSIQKAAMPTNGKGGKAAVPTEVRQWESVVRSSLQGHGLEDYTELFLALIMQESGGKLLDVAQSSESIGLPVNSITDQVQSIQVGGNHFANVMKMATDRGITDIRVILQAYNMGPGFILYAAENGKEWSEDLAKGFALQHATRSECGFRSPYCYGDFTYVPKIMKNFQSEASGIAVSGGDTYNTILSEMLKYEGFPYAWGGANPSTSFDCSGLMQWAYAKVGIQLPRTAGEQYKATVRIEESQLQPGDLIFFTGTSDHAYISHVAMYTGNGTFYQSASSGVGYAKLEGYWREHVIAFGRIK